MLIPLLLGGGSALGTGLGAAFGQKKRQDQTQTTEQQTSYGFAPESQSMRDARRRITGLNDINANIAQRFGGTYAALAKSGEKLASGEFLDPNDPANASYVEAVQRPLKRGFEETTIPGLQSFVASARGYGGERGGDLFRRAYRDYSESVGDVTSRALTTLGELRTKAFETVAGGVGDAISRFMQGAGMEAGIAQTPVVTGQRGRATGRQVNTESTSDMFGNSLLSGLLMYGGAKNI